MNQRKFDYAKDVMSELIDRCRDNVFPYGYKNDEKIYETAKELVAAYEETHSDCDIRVKISGVGF